MLPYMDADITTFSDYSVIGRQMAQSAAFAISAFRFEFFFSNFFFRFVCLLFVLMSFFSRCYSTVHLLLDHTWQPKPANKSAKL